MFPQGWNNSMRSCAPTPRLRQLIENDYVKITVNSKYKSADFSHSMQAMLHWHTIVITFAEGWRYVLSVNGL